MDSSSGLAESPSDRDNALRDGDYWKAGVKVPGLPSWISRRRSPDSRAASEVWGGSCLAGARFPAGCMILRTPGGTFITEDEGENFGWVLCGHLYTFKA